MPTNILVPRLGEGVEEVTITKWLKAVGESVNELEPLLEVNTDKVDTEIPAPASGVILSIHAPEGQTARVGELLAVIGQAGEAEAGTDWGAEKRIDEPTGDQGPQTAPEPVAVRGLSLVVNHELGFISPVIAKIAAEHGVNLQQVTGTGLNGRITKNDVLQFVENEKQTTDHQPQTVAETPNIVHRSSSMVALLTPETGTLDTLLPLTPIRKAIAAHMVESKHTSPHVLTVMEADLSRVLAHRAAHKEAFARDGVNLTLTAYFMTAIVAGLKAFPLVNSSWSEAGILLHKAIHLGMATSLGEDGLIVPVIKNADALSLLGLARAINDLAGRARARKLQPDEVRGGTFTLTNHGLSGSLFAFPVINQPQCGILGIGALQKRVVVVTDELGRDTIAIRPLVYLSFVFDHRLLDGASADWFLAKIKETLENWK
jgi:pyruvate/2-oxoglutarate dehydrogenase complex dihydrolipoamide acyltransferase (E2) component